MKKCLQLVGCLALAVLAPGCFIQALHPFCTDDAVIDQPAVVGKWRLVRRGDEELAEKYKEPWVFDKDSMTTFEKGVPSPLKTKYFTVGKHVFVDLTAGEVDETRGPNPWWSLHVVPVHSVCKVAVTVDSLHLTPLNGDWVKKMLEAKEFSLPYVPVDAEGDQIVLTADSKALMSFLGKVAGNTNAFSEDTAHVFRKLVE